MAVEDRVVGGETELLGMLEVDVGTFAFKPYIRNGRWIDGTAGRRRGAAPVLEGRYDHEIMGKNNPLSSTWVDELVGDLVVPEDEYLVSQDVRRLYAAREPAKRLSIELVASLMMDDPDFVDWADEALNRTMGDASQLTARIVRHYTGLSPTADNANRTTLEMLSEYMQNATTPSGVDPRALMADGASLVIIDQWARSSSDGESMSVAAQLAAAEVHGTDATSLREYMSSWERGATTLAAADSILSSDGAALRSFVAQEYAATQAYLEERSLKTVRVLRGVGSTTNPDRGSVVAVEANPTSSWSTDSDTAFGFAESISDDSPYFGLVMAMDVPASMVQSTPLTGRGALSEWEVTVLNLPAEATVARVVDYRRETTGYVGVEP